MQRRARQGVDRVGRVWVWGQLASEHACGFNESTHPGRERNTQVNMAVGMSAVSGSHWYLSVLPTRRRERSSHARAHTARDTTTTPLSGCGQLIPKSSFKHCSARPSVLIKEETISFFPSSSQLDHLEQNIIQQLKISHSLKVHFIVGTI